MRSGDYRPRQHINRVLAGSQARHSSRAVLMHLCHMAEFDRPEVTITRPQIEASLGYCTKTVKMALKELREEGSIKPIQGFAGGRGNAVTYSLIPVGQGAQQPAQGAGQGSKKERQARFVQLLKTESYASARAIMESEGWEFA